MTHDWDVWTILICLWLSLSQMLARSSWHRYVQLMSSSFPVFSSLDPLNGHLHHHLLHAANKVLTISEDNSHACMEVVRWLQKVWISEIKIAFTYPCINHCLQSQFMYSRNPIHNSVSSLFLISFKHFVMYDVHIFIDQSTNLEWIPEGNNNFTYTMMLIKYVLK